MTLNITVLTPKIIYQSADFKISNLEGAQLSFNPSPKIIEISFSSWHGLLTYTGLGYWRGRDMSAFVEDWLTGLEDIGMIGTARVIETEGTKVLQDYESSHQRIPHTFTLAGFEDGQRPRVCTISNREDCFGVRRKVIDDRLIITTRRTSSDKKAIVIVTGSERAVPKTARRELQRVAENYPNDTLRVRSRIQKVNADAVKSGKTKGTVSEDCAVLSLRPDGSSIMQINRDSTETPALFPQIMHGINMRQQFAEAIKKMGLDLSQVRPVQGFSVTLGDKQIKNKSAVSCRYGVKIPDAESGYGLREVKSNNFQPVQAIFISDNGQMIGTGRSAAGGEIKIPWSYRDEKIERLNFEGSVVAVNESGQVAATGFAVDGQRALLYENGFARELPLYHGETGVFSGTDSQAFGLSNNSLVVGSMRSKPEEKSGTGNVNSYAAAFRFGDSTRLCTLAAQGGCHAVDVNENNYVLVAASMAIFETRSVVWNLMDDTWEFVGSSEIGVYPLAINNRNVILGQGRNVNGQHVAVICTVGKTWERLGTPDGWIPADLNDHGEVIGKATVDGLDRPWLFDRNGRIKFLPYLTNHNHNLHSINNSGQIVGTAAADDDSHAVIWET
jgi:hypothetical protein